MAASKSGLRGARDAVRRLFALAQALTNAWKVGVLVREELLMTAHFTSVTNPRHVVPCAMVLLAGLLVTPLEAADGNPDARFGSGGIVQTDFIGGVDSASSIAIQP